MSRVVVVCLLTLCDPALALAQQPPAATLAERTTGMTRADGFVPFYWDAARGRVLMEIPSFNEDVLYYVSAASGGGSVELSFDRGIMGTSVVHFQRSGPRVLVTEQNLRYRAVNGHAALQENVRDSFPTSVLAALPGRRPIGRARAGGRHAALHARRRRRDRQAAFDFNQGAFPIRRRPQRALPPRMKAFPDNTEIETILTFAADTPGRIVANVTPDPQSFSMRIHHSFLRAPTGYTPRPANPRIGVSSVKNSDYAEPFNQNTDVEWVTRWRLKKQNPGAAMSEPKKPIVFYLDAAIPDRSAAR